MDEDNSLYVKEQRVWQSCPYCRSQKQPLFIHGSYHCIDCKTNVGCCCEGEWDIRALDGDYEWIG